MGTAKIMLQSEIPKVLEDVTLSKSVTMEDDTQIKKKALLRAIDTMLKTSN
jgi:hypothetical protein